MEYHVSSQVGTGLIGDSFIAHTSQCENSKKLLYLSIHEKFMKATGLQEQWQSDMGECLKISHPHLLTPYECSVSEDGWFVVSEYIKGTSLDVLMNKRKQIPHYILLSAAMQILLGLQSLHQANSLYRRRALVHQHIHSSQVLISADGSVFLKGLGLARLYEYLWQEQPGEICQRISYRAPEQWAGEEPDPRSDLFAVGVLLYEGLTGCRLYEQEAPEQAKQKAQSVDTPPMQDWLPGVDPRLAKIVQRAMHPRPERRFSSAKEFYDVLESYIIPTSLEQLRRATGDYLHAMLGDDAPTPERNESNALSISIQHAAKPLVYVCAQDKVFGQDLLFLLQDATQGGRFLDVKLLNSSADYAEALRQMEQLEVVPCAVLFGSLYVGMEHPYLKAIQQYPEIAKVLVTEQTQPEILQQAVRLCGLDSIMQLPFQVDLLVSLLYQRERTPGLLHRLMKLQQRIRSVEQHEISLRAQITALARTSMNTEHSVIVDATPSPERKFL